MTTGGFLQQLAMAIGFVAAALLFYVVVKALWAEIGPMIRLLFRRASRTAADEDNGVELKQ